LIASAFAGERGDAVLGFVSLTPGFSPVIGTYDDKGNRLKRFPEAVAIKTPPR
jgi:hypothetical protein